MPIREKELSEVLNDDEQHSSSGGSGSGDYDNPRGDDVDDEYSTEGVDNESGGNTFEPDDG